MGIWFKISIVLISRVTNLQINAFIVYLEFFVKRLVGQIAGPLVLLRGSAAQLH